MSVTIKVTSYSVDAPAGRVPVESLQEEGESFVISVQQPLPLGPSPQLKGLFLSLRAELYQTGCYKYFKRMTITFPKALRL